MSPKTNLLDLYDSLSLADRESAKVSFRRYNTLLRAIGDATNFEIEIAAGVFSALSPNNNYLGNLRNTKTLLTAAHLGHDIDDFKVNTYHQNKHKAWLIATRRVLPIYAFKTLKTKSFFMNTADPDNPDWVTIDGHMFWAWSGRRGVVKSRSPERAHTAPPTVNGKLYVDIAEDVRWVAAERGVIPNQAQAVIWHAYRIRHGVQGVRQLDLIPHDTEICGVDPSVLPGFGR